MPKRKRQRRPLTLRTPAGLSPLQKAALKEAQAAAETEAHARLLKAPRYNCDMVRPDTIEARERLRRVARGLFSNSPPPKDRSGPHHREAVISFVKRFHYTRFEKEIYDVWRHWTQHSNRVLEPSNVVRPWIPRTEWDLVEENAGAEGLSGEQYLDREALKELHIYCRKHGIPLEPGPADAALAPKPPAAQATTPAAFALDKKRQRGWAAENWHDLTHAQTELLSVLNKARGEWVTGRTCCERPDKEIKKLPPPVRDLVESQRGPNGGYRLKPDLFLSGRKGGT